MRRLFQLAFLAAVPALLTAAPSGPLSLWVLGDDAARRSGLREAVAARLTEAGYEVRTPGTWTDGVALPDGVDALCDAVRGADVIVFCVAPEGQGLPGRSPAEAFASWRSAAWTLSVNNPEAQLVLTTALPAGGEAVLADICAFNESVREESTRNPRNIGTFPLRTTAFCELGGSLPRWKESLWRADGLALTADGVREAAELVYGVLEPRLKDFRPPVRSAVMSAVMPQAGGAARHVPESYRSGFTCQRTLEIGERHRFEPGQPPVYDWTNATAAAVGPAAPVRRIAYYLELVRKGGGPVRYVWCDMEAYAGTLGEMEVPTSVTRQTRVRRLHVFSNMHGVENISSSEDYFEGFVEFSPYGYGADGACGWRPPHGAPAGCVGWGDRFGDGSGETYGSMQVFRCRDERGVARPPELLFAWNRFALPGEGGVNEIGIGPLCWRRDGRVSEDWTFTSEEDALNASAYAVRHLEIWTRRN